MDIFNTVTGFGQKVMGFKENRFQVTKLKQEVRDVQLFLVYLKELINTLIKSKINFCHLPTLIDSVNAFQIFLDKNILGYNTKIVDKAFIEKWPEWYRPELKTMINLIMYHIQILQQEYNGYHAIALEKLLGNKNEKKLLTEIRKQLRKKNSECSYFAKSYKKIYEEEGSWDVCPRCTDIAFMNNLFGGILDDTIAEYIKKWKKDKAVNNIDTSAAAGGALFKKTCDSDCVLYKNWYNKNIREKYSKDPKNKKIFDNNPELFLITDKIASEHIKSGHKKYDLFKMFGRKQLAGRKK